MSLKSSLWTEISETATVQGHSRYKCGRLTKKKISNMKRVEICEQFMMRPKRAKGNTLVTEID